MEIVDTLFLLMMAAVFKNTLLKKFSSIKLVDKGRIITYNKSTKNHTIFSTKKGVIIYVSSKEYGRKR